VKSYFENSCLFAAVLSVLLSIGGVEQNSGPDVNVESFMQVLCSGCERILKSGTQWDTCGRCFHNSCGNVKAQLVESGKWNCERCKWEMFFLLEEKLQKALNQIEDLKLRKKGWKNNYEWRQVDMKLTGRSRCRKITKVKNICFWVIR
jgi:hypothetical protein